MIVFLEIRCLTKMANVRFETTELLFIHGRDLQPSVLIILILLNQVTYKASLTQLESHLYSTDHPRILITSSFVQALPNTVSGRSVH